MNNHYREPMPIINRRNFLRKSSLLAAAMSQDLVIEFLELYP